MSHVLVVDDSATDRKLAGFLLGKDEELEVRFAENGRVALDSITADRPDIVLSDLQMPEMNGLELVEEVRRKFPSIPVILMTARGSEEIAAEALRRGAAAYVPKVSLANQLQETVSQILTAAQADRLHSRLMHTLQSASYRFVLQNDPSLFAPLVDRVQEHLRCMRLEDESERLRVGQAVGHALWIAHLHGNLEIPIDSDVDDESFAELARERCREAPWSTRSITVDGSLESEQFVFRIVHEGAAIDFSQLPDNLESAAIDRSWLSRFLLIPNVMNDFSIEDEGRCLQLLKKPLASEDDDFEMTFGD